VRSVELLAHGPRISPDMCVATAPAWHQYHVGCRAPSVTQSEGSMTARYEGGSTGRMATRPLYAASAGLITALISSAHGKSVKTLVPQRQRRRQKSTVAAVALVTAVVPVAAAVPPVLQR
jgi:hypothetical protein